MPPPPPPPIQSLPDELLEEIFFRLPPNEPACLVRASVANKRWLGVLSCHAFRGRYRPFQVVFLGLDMTDDDNCVAHARVSAPVTEILKYDLSSNCLWLIDAPLSGAIISGSTILMAMEDGSLGFAHVDKSRRTHEPIPIQNPTKRLKLIGSVEGSDTIFITADLGIYEVNIRTLQWKKLWKREKFRYLIPYMSFYNPPGIIRKVVPRPQAIAITTQACLRHSGHIF
uniref:Uncharacterized protein n=1 Tax=Aegilops tauschii TaxID=37682 RepID=N1R2X4_AEGTA